MTTYIIDGYKFSANSDAALTQVETAELQVIAPAGGGQFGFRYLTDDTANAEVSLSDYNLKIDGQHINDGALPDKLELYGLTWSGKDGPVEATVFNLNFSEEGSVTDFSFSVKGASLPDLSDLGAAGGFVDGAKAFKLGAADDLMTISLPEIPDVRVADILNDLFDLEAQDTASSDVFDFGSDRDTDAILGDEYEVMEEIARLSEEAEQETPDASAAANADLPDTPTDADAEIWNDIA